MTMSWSLFLVSLLAIFLAGVAVGGWWTMRVILCLVRRKVITDLEQGS